MLYTLIAILIVMTLVSFVIFDKDVFAPPTVLCLGFLFSAFCALYNEKEWGLEFSGQTTVFIATGVGAFIVGGCLSAYAYGLFGLGIVGFSHRIDLPTAINIQTFKTVAVIAFQLATFVLLFQHVRRLSGYSSWLSAVARYRELTSRLADPDDPSIRMPFLLRNMVQVGFAVGLVYSYVLGNNIAAKQLHPSLAWAPIILSAIMTFVQGDRSNMIRLWLTVLITAFTLSKRATGYRNNKDTKKMVRNMGLSLIGIGVLFVGLREIVGRTNTMDPLRYVTFYAGCPTAALDEFLKHPIPPSDIWGKETFFYTNVTLSVFFGRPERYNFYKEFITSPNGTLIGNVYTALRPPYYDFGFGGMVLVMFIMGMFFTVLYCRVRKRSGRGPIDFRLLVYCYIAYTYFLYFYNCYNAFLSHTFIKFCIELFVVSWVLVGFRLKLKSESTMKLRN